MTGLTNDDMVAWAAIGERVQDSFGLSHARVRLHSPGAPDGYTVQHGYVGHGYRVDPTRDEDASHIFAAVSGAVAAAGLVLYTSARLRSESDAVEWEAQVNRGDVCLGAAKCQPSLAAAALRAYLLAVSQ